MISHPLRRSAPSAWSKPPLDCARPTPALSGRRGGRGVAKSKAEPVSHERVGKASQAPMSWKKAIKPDYIISFEDGKQYKSMKRHLTRYGLSPEQYREKWGLPRDFPMVAPNYAAARSEMAKRIGLGRKGPAARKAKGGPKKAAASRA